MHPRIPSSKKSRQLILKLCHTRHLSQEANAEAPLYLIEQFTRVSAITSRISRSSSLSLRSPRLKSRHGKNCFAYGESSVELPT